MKNPASYFDQIPAIMVSLVLFSSVLSAQDKEAVNVKNLARAETDGRYQSLPINCRMK